MIRKATHGGWAIGSERFKAQIEALSRRRATPRPQGRKAARQMVSDPLSSMLAGNGDKKGELA